jgi:hypothetical protein
MPQFLTADANPGTASWSFGAGAGTAITAARTLTTAESGNTFACTQDGGGYVVRLPATATSDGVSYTFILTTAAAGNLTIQANAAEATLLGSMTQAGNSLAVPAGTVSVAFDGGTAVVGDHFTVICDGTRWITWGTGSNANSFIVT